MKKPFNELNEDAKATYGLNGGTSSKAWLYCTACGRAMEQGGCFVDDAESSLQCAYEDCTSEGNLAFESLYGWDAYREMWPALLTERRRPTGRRPRPRGSAIGRKVRARRRAAAERGRRQDWLTAGSTCVILYVRERWCRARSCTSASGPRARQQVSQGSARAKAPNGGNHPR